MRDKVQASLLQSHYINDIQDIVSITTFGSEWRLAQHYYIFLTHYKNSTKIDNWNRSAQGAYKHLNIQSSQ